MYTSILWKLFSSKREEVKITIYVLLLGSKIQRVISVNLICKTTQMGWNPFTITAIDLHCNSKFILHSRKENPQSIKIKPNKPKAN